MMNGNDLWVFAYGSLLWDPGFEPAEAVRARLDGWRRSFCMWSHMFRGSEEAPGLVLALDADPQASCEGLALRVDPAGKRRSWPRCVGASSSRTPTRSESSP
ncbi:Cation transport protein chaC [Rubellimicrobium mesophilum DSM 19309]|uniref:glutathione-specific gamma-glutamylcyclotransferase n=1 Tax=Rubellimicrobium mesophilum DSM 19309 TaxID=442562 RepID=A0A017HSW8_9RHOB|nr:Cation transport protein chaC [Rubellimicrobium mesophilum DSM 19309]